VDGWAAESADELHRLAHLCMVIFFCSSD
jgi:hypothetical protein